MNKKIRKVIFPLCATITLSSCATAPFSSTEINLEADDIIIDSDVHESIPNTLNTDDGSDDDEPKECVTPTIEDFIDCAGYKIENKDTD